MTRERGQQVLMGIVGVALVAVAVGQYVYGRGLSRRYRAVVESRRQLELQFGEFLTTHEQIKTELAKERQHSQELSGALTTVRAQLEESIGRLAQTIRNQRELELRLTSAHQQVGQLQGELSTALQDAEKSAKAAPSSSTVQLDRVVVTDSGASSLQGRVVSVHRDWNFVVIDLGWGQVKIGDTISIFRKEQLLAKARIERVQEGVCAATVLPGWETAEIQVNDTASVL